MEVFNIVSETELPSSLSANTNVSDRLYCLCSSWLTALEFTYSSSSIWERRELLSMS